MKVFSVTLLVTIALSGAFAQATTQILINSLDDVLGYWEHSFFSPAWQVPSSIYIASTDLRDLTETQTTSFGDLGLATKNLFLENLDKFTLEFAHGFELLPYDKPKEKMGSLIKNYQSYLDIAQIQIDSTRSQIVGSACFDAQLIAINAEEDQLRAKVADIKSVAENQLQSHLNSNLAEILSKIATIRNSVADGVTVEELFTLARQLQLYCIAIPQKNGQLSADTISILAVAGIEFEAAGITAKLNALNILSVAQSC